MSNLNQEVLLYTLKKIGGPKVAQLNTPQRSSLKSQKWSLGPIGPPPPTTSSQLFVKFIFSPPSFHIFKSISKTTPSIWASIGVYYIQHRVLNISSSSPMYVQKRAHIILQIYFIQNIVDQPIYCCGGGDALMHCLDD